MHIIQILDHQIMGHPVKCFAEVDSCNHHSMRIFQIQVLMKGEMEGEILELVFDIQQPIALDIL